MPSILIVDHDPKLRALLEEVLTATGHEVHLADSARQALRVAEEVVPDLAIVESHLTDVGGMEFLRELRARGHSRVKVILLASLASFWQERESYANQTVELGIDVLLCKPFSVSEFMAQLETLFPPDGAGTAGQARFLAVAEGLSDSQTLALNLAKLRDEYSANLLIELDLLQEALAQVRMNPGESQLVQHAYDTASRIYGRAASFGFPEVGEAAGTIAGYLQDLLLGEEFEPETTFRLIEETLIQAQQSFERTRATEPWQTYSRGLPHKRFPIASVLVFDRDPDHLRELEKLGLHQLVHVVPASSEAEAVKSVQEGWFDGVFVGAPTLLAPGFFELVDHLRAPRNLSDLPIACMSEIASMAERVAAAKAGCALFLLKPVNEQQFLDAVRQMVAMRRPDRPRILILDGNKAFAQQTALLLEQERMAATALSDLESIEELLALSIPDLILLNINLPAVSGFDLCRMIRSDPGWRDVLVLFMADYVRDDYRRDIRIACFQAGGDDCLFKPVPKEELLARIRAPLARVSRQQERSDHDELTGLLNRGGLLEAVGMRLAEFKRQSRPFSLALIDIDHFREIQTLLGHLTADRVLAGLGQLLSSRLRVEDVRGRWSGDLFVLTLVGVSPEKAKIVLTRVQEEFREMVFEGEFKETFRVSFSAGIAGFPEDGERLDELVRAADQRLNAAKEGGRNQIRI
ncbi:MAG: response regulator [Bradymonadales bacterium]|nr:response regulator [Bradymonadales bacterium]